MLLLLLLYYYSVFRNSTTALVEGNNSPTQRMTLHSVGGEGEEKEKCGPQ